MPELILAVSITIAAVGFVLFTFVVFFGAPFLPTLRPQVTNALELLNLKKGQTLLELGSGDGRVMVEAAERGLNVIGFELNPILAAFSWLRTRKYKGQVKVVWGNFWSRKWPKADGIFVFLLNPYMDKLDKKITQELNGRKVKLVSFAFEIPGKKPKSKKKGLYLYQY